MPSPKRNKSHLSTVTPVSDSSSSFSPSKVSHKNSKVAPTNEEDGDERMRKKMTKSESSLMEVKQEVISPFMISYSNPLRISWDWFLALLLLYIIITTPLEVAFEEPSADEWVWIGRIVDLFFWCDLIISFRTTFQTPSGEEVWDQRLAAKVYMRGWFTLDFLTCVFAFPMGDLLASLMSGDSVGAASAAKVGKAPRILKVMRSARAVKVLRLAKINELLEDVRDRFAGAYSIVKILRLLVLIVTFLHLNACGWCLVGDAQAEDQSWLDSFGRDELSWDEKYLTAFYWATTTCTTVGYGDIGPVSDAEKVYTVISMVIGVCFYAYLIGVMTDVITSVGQVEAQVEHRMEEIYAFIDKYRLSPGLSKSIRLFCRRHYKTRRLVDTQAILEMLPARLMEETREEIVAESLSSIAFFHHLPTANFPAALQLLQEVHFKKGERIFVANDTAHPEFYFLTNGSVAIHKPTYRGDANDGDSDHASRVAVQRKRLLGVQKIVSRRREDASKLDFTPDEVHRALSHMTGHSISRGESRMAFAAMNVDEDDRADMDEFLKWYMRKYVESDDAAVLGDAIVVMKPFASMGTWTAFDIGKGKEMSSYTYIATQHCVAICVCADELMSEFADEPLVLEMIEKEFVAPARKFGQDVDVKRTGLFEQTGVGGTETSGKPTRAIRRRNTSKRLLLGPAAAAHRPVPQEDAAVTRSKGPKGIRALEKKIDRLASQIDAIGKAVCGDRGR